MTQDTLTPRLALVRRDCRVRSDLIDAFDAWVRSAPDTELYRVDILGWAARHHATEDEALDLFLHAASAGIFQLSWGVICPSCGMMIQTPGGLRALGPEPHCRLCRMSFPAAADDQLEVTFSLEPHIRTLRFYEPGGIDPVGDGFQLFFGSTREPAGVHKALGNMMKAGAGIAPGGTAEVEVTLDGGMGAILVPNLHAIAFAEIAPGHPSEASFEVHDGAMLPGMCGLAPGPLKLRLTNRTHHHVTVCVAQLPIHLQDELSAPPVFEVRPFLTGKRVLTSQTFGDLFRTESISAQGLSIKNLAVLFTDLKSSTALYERVGDLRAFELVRAHFDKLIEVVRQHRGALVKTIGDAVMAAFVDPERAVAAAAAMNRAMETLGADDERLTLKIGVHAGSCIAIQTNHQLDYFGSAVNTAARVQGVARGGEIVVTDAVWNAPSVSQLVERLGLRSAPDHVTLRGIAAPVAIHRLNQPSASHP